MCHVKHSDSQNIFCYSFKNIILNVYSRPLNLLSHLISEGGENETACCTVGGTRDHKTKHRLALSHLLKKSKFVGGIFIISKLYAYVHKVGTLKEIQ